jgi:2-iminoacetate synthase
MQEPIIREDLIAAQLAASADTSPARIREILAKAREMRGLARDEVLALVRTTDEALVQELFETARAVKEGIYGNRLVLFAPLYISNLCENDCAYCAFRKANKDVLRRALSYQEIRAETRALLAQGQRRLLLVAGESYNEEGLKYVFNAIDTIYAVKTDHGNIRRINVNIAPLSVEEFRALHAHAIGTYQLFQETYHEPTYRRLHPRGPKADYRYRLETMDRAFEGGFDDVGIGVLFGLYDWRFELTAILDHIAHLERTFGVGPHTISVPRLEPAFGAPLSFQPPHAASDDEFKRIIAILRCTVPYTGIILSTRESATMRRTAFELGISQISAGSRTNPGGYTHDEAGAAQDAASRDCQFSLGDTRSMIEVVRDIVRQGHIPSFCTACYRLGRVGKDFMDLAKPGLIRDHCLPNAILTFAEYLHDFADAPLRTEGETLIARMLEREIRSLPLQAHVREQLAAIRAGKRDIYV